MCRQIAYAVACATIAVCLAAGCGPADRPATGPQSPTSPPTHTDTTAPTGPPATGAAPTGPAVPAARKTWTRDEIKAFLMTAIKTTDVQAKFGRPDSTREATMVHPRQGGSLRVTYLIYTYRDMSVDAAGSGKVDREVLIYFNNGNVQQNLTDFNP